MPLLGLLPIALSASPTATVKPAPPLFRVSYWARIVGLRSDLALADVRRDGRAIGTATDHGPDWYKTHAFLVFGGIGRVGKESDDSAPSDWSSEPAAITGTNAFVLRYQSNRKPQMFYRSARLVEGVVRVGPKVKAPGSMPPGVRFGIRETIDFPRPLWPVSHEVPGPDALNVYSTRMEIAWAPLRGNVKVGTVGESPTSENGADPYFYNVHHNALVKVNGRVSTLASRTRGGSSLGFGSILYVAKAGWLVVTIGEQDGLAWLEPIAAPAPARNMGRTSR